MTHVFSLITEVTYIQQIRSDQPVKTVELVNGLGSTGCGPEDEPIPDCPNGLGNLIVGYNESRGGSDIRTGSHNVVMGQGNNFSRFGGLGSPGEQ